MGKIDFLRKALANANVKAFLMMIRHCEGTAAADGYTYLFGCTPKNKLTFGSFDHHPNRRYVLKDQAGKRIVSTAAGAYQILYGTYNGLKVQYGFTDFTPETQDLMAVALLSEMNCVMKLMAGEFEFALDRANNIWASLPGANVNQPEKKLVECKAWYKQYGGADKNEIAVAVPEKKIA